MKSASENRPLIAVTSSERGNRTAWLAARWLVHRAGGRAVRVRPSRLLESFGPVDGLVVLGGVDIDPELYGGTRDGRRRLEAARDERELEMVGSALDQDLPLLGICRGAQLLNVALGGTLERLPTPRLRTPFPYRRAWLEPDTDLRRITGRRIVWINTLHDYTVDRLGAGIEVTARDSDGVVQAIDRCGASLAIGVQWHPELMPYTRTSRQLFSAVVHAARIRPEPVPCPVGDDPCSAEISARGKTRRRRKGGPPF